MDGAVKPWEWNEVSIEWLDRTLVVMDAHAHVREVAEKKARK